MKGANWPEYWWSRITGPQELVESIISALREKRSVVVVVPHDLPWRHELRKVVIGNLEAVSGLDGLIPHTIDIEDEGAGKSEPGRLLLDKYALRDDRINYRDGGQESIQQYMLRKDVMGNQIVWVKGFGANSSKPWIDFCEKWAVEQASDGLFVIETCDTPQAERSRHLEIIHYDDLVGEYDARLFNSLVLGDDEAGALNTIWKQYAAAITSHLCGTDAEVAQEFIGVHDFKRDDPLQTIATLADSETFARRGSGSHVFALHRADDTTSLIRRVWAGQVEILFPIIEKKRLEIVEKCQEQLDYRIAMGLTQFDSPVEKASDVELGTLAYLCSSRKIDIRDRETRDRIFFLRECRNRLAHRDLCSVEQVSLLLG